MRYVVAVLAVLAFCGPVYADQEKIVGVVTDVHDGDTLTMRVGDATKIEVRLSEIDAPEVRHGKAPDQPYGIESRDLLSKLARGKTCEATVSTVDRYGRSVARVDCDSVHVNRIMVRQGAAWVYLKYDHTVAMELEENQAQNARLGLWALPEEQQVEPWLWRKGEGWAVAPTPKPKPQVFSCETKKLFCSQMASCAEATFYLKQCGKKSLDSDMDGRPCEALCGQ